jgi:hypothetical protein
MFPMCSCKVPQGFPSCSPNIPNSTTLFSHMVCPKLISHVYKLKRCTTRSTSIFIFQLAVQSGASIGECPMFQKNDDSPLKKKKKNRKKCEQHSSTIISMNYKW